MDVTAAQVLPLGIPQGKCRMITSMGTKLFHLPHFAAVTIIAAGEWNARRGTGVSGYTVLYQR